MILANVQLPEGATQPRTDYVMHKIIPIIKEEKSVESVMDIIGFSMLSFIIFIEVLCQAEKTALFGRLNGSCICGSFQHLSIIERGKL